MGCPRYLRPDLAKNMKLGGPNQLWVADITYVTIDCAIELKVMALFHSRLVSRMLAMASADHRAT
jgi:hypothetical protein